jgi:20S proteasome subunit alpha 5
MTLVEAETLAMKTLKQVMEEKLTATNVEIASVSAETGKFTVYSKEALEAVIERIPETNPLGEPVA